MKKTFSVSETAETLGYSKNSIYSFLKEGLIKSVRIGNGKFRIPEEEVEKFTKGRVVKAKTTKIVKPVTVSTTTTQSVPDLPISTFLESPRPGMSLASLSGETVVHTFRLWIEERVGLPKLFDWLVSLTSIILGVSLYLYSSQTDILLGGRLSVWMDPIRLTLIFGGVGLILASMIQAEANSKLNLVNLFHYTITIAFLGLAIILLSGGDLDGFMIYGLFGLMILIDTLSGLDMATTYMFYIFGLLVGIFAIYRFFPAGSGLSVVTSGLINVLSFYSWILVLIIVLLVAMGLYGFLWNRRFLKLVVMIYGFILCALSLFYGAGNYWSRAFVLLISGMIGLVLPSWEGFKAKLETDRPLVFKMFGTVLVCFAIPILLVAVVQGTLVSNAYRNLSDKADFASMSLGKILDDNIQGAIDLSNNPNFVTAFVRGQNEELMNQLRFLSLGRNEVEITGVINSKGKPLAVYPSSITYNAADFSKADFFTTVMRTGNNYISKNLESFGTGVDKVLLVAVPAVDNNNVISGVLVVALSGVNLTNSLQQVSEKTLGQEVIVVGDEAKTVVYPDVAKLGMILNEGDKSYEIWKDGLGRGEGYNWNGVHSVFGASNDSKYGMTVVFSQPIRKVLDVSTSWLAWLLFLQLIVGMVVFASFIYVKNTRPKEET